jgi:phospholipid/cholesterol/gamma-HCH transport system ATP-binding protein
VSEPRGTAVALRGVTKRYGDTPVLAGVDLEVAPGELVAILGQSGQGKSVLLRLVAGLEEPSGGRVLVAGLDVAAYRALPAARKPFRLAMVFQNAALLGSLTVAENVGLRLREHGTDAATTRDVTADVLARVDLAGAAEKRPAALSGGMRKRAAIARALAVAPHLILYDEPTADLDPILTEQIATLIRRIRDERGATQIVVTHHVPLACAVADRIAVLDGGRIVDHGPLAAILASRNPVTRAFVRASTIAPTSAEVSC